MRRLAAAAVTAVLLIPQSAQAKEIELDEVIVQEGTDSGVMERIPFAGQWWSFQGGKLSKGVLSQPNFMWEAARTGYDEGQSIVDDDASPLLKYDRFVERRFGTNPGTARYELEGDGGRFDHHIDPVEASNYDDEGVSYGWWGHCNGWAASAIMEREPHVAIDAEGIRFDVLDLKGLLAEVFWSVRSDFTGSRYNDPGWREDSHDSAGELLDALEAGSPKPADEYKDWYVDLYKQWTGNDSYELTGDYPPSAFRGVLEWFTGWYKETYTDAFADLAPHVFHRILVTTIRNRGTGIVFDMDAGAQVWNFPAHAYETELTFLRDGANGGKVYSVSTQVHYQSDGVDHAILGVVEHTNDYTYELETDAVGRPVGGTWTGSSVDEHPDFAWLPTFNRSGPDGGENRKIEWRKVQELLSRDHERADTRLVTLKVNGTASDDHRLGREARTVRNPLAASGALTLTADVAPGEGVDRVAYYRQRIAQAGWGDNWKAERGDLEHLGDGVGADRSLSWTGTDAGRFMFVAKAFAGDDLVSFDELTVQYTLVAAPDPEPDPDPQANDDAFEENDTRDTAATITVGSHDNLRCEDEDWFAVQIPQGGGELKVTITFRHSDGDLDMSLQDAAGSRLSSSTSTSNSETVRGSGLAAGIYHVRVYGYRGARAEYDMSVAVTAGSQAANDDDAFEENDSRTTAAAISDGRHAGLRCRDDDWFAVDVDAGRSLEVRIEFRHADGDLDLYLYDANGLRLARSWSTSDNEQVSHDAQSATTVYVQVVGYRGASSDYDLIVR